jgi:hypothetical protein
MTQVSYKDLVIEKEYIIYRPDDKFNIFWKGTFRGEYQRYYEHCPNLVFVDCVRKDNSGCLTRDGTMNVGPYKNRADFRKTYIFHDLEKVKDNREKAIQNMEKRSLDIILKRLINEHFQW